MLFFQRSRKCSIVQEDEEEEDISNCSGREELVPAHCSLNRRGSRSEGRLNIALQERLAESERRKQPNVVNEKMEQIKKLEEIRPKSADDKARLLQRRMGKSSSIPESNHMEDITNTTIITESSTITIPVVTNSSLSCQILPKYKTMPSPTRANNNTTTTSPLQLNEIFEEGDIQENNQRPSRQFVSRAQNRTTYEQRRSKFHKTRTASCSSSDASDDDSENRKKRAHKLNTNATKPIQTRRDSHDDSSDSQEPGGCGGSGSGGGGRTLNAGTVVNNEQQVQEGENSGGNNGETGGGSGRKNADMPNVVFGKRHKTSRRRNGETRLRESQSLNRITEVQEDTSHTIVIATTVSQGQNVTPKVKSFGARLLQGFSSKKTDEKTEEKTHHLSRKDGVYCMLSKELVPEKKKIRLLGKYFQVHKRLCIPIPGLFTKNRLYKAQSCGSLARDRVSLGPEAVLRCRQRAVSVIRNSIGSDGDINQNTGQKTDKRRSSSTVVQLNNVCNELTGICAVHLGQASKCCSFC